MMKRKIRITVSFVLMIVLLSCSTVSAEGLSFDDLFAGIDSDLESALLEALLGETPEEDPALSGDGMENALLRMLGVGSADEESMQEDEGVLIVQNSDASSDGISLEEALGLVGTDQKRVLLSDDFSAYDYFSSPLYTGNTGKFVVLYRYGPEKEFTISDTRFSDEFNGVDADEPEVYLDLEAMAQIPEEYRATTVDEIGNIIFVETFYVHTGTISSRRSMFEERVTAAGLEAAMKGEEENSDLPTEDVEISFEYKPVFTGCAVVALYDAADGSSWAFDLAEFSYAELRKNPEASDISDVVYQIAPLYNACLEQNESEYYTSGEMLLLYDGMDDSFLEDEDADRIAELMDMGAPDYDAAKAFAVELIWDCAAQLRELDSANRHSYDAVIEEKSLNGLFYILANSDYNGIRKSDMQIIFDKDYLGKIDTKKLEEIREETLEVMGMIDWNPVILNEILTEAGL